MIFTSLINFNLSLQPLPVLFYFLAGFSKNSLFLLGQLKLTATLSLLNCPLHKRFKRKITNQLSLACLNSDGWIPPDLYH